MFCSTICRHAYLRSKYSTPIPEHDCQGCGVKFESRRASKFCGMKCYTGSKQFTEMIAESREKSQTPWSIARRAEIARRGEGRPCLECGNDVYIKKSEKTKKFCSTVCYRNYMAKRFDRQIAAPEKLSLPQGYDEFLTKDRLPCLIEGCGWEGSHLSLHMNQAHGVIAEEFKRAAGFNMHSGIVSLPLSEALSARPLVGVAKDADLRVLGKENLNAKKAFKYRSLEGKEHHAKSRSLLLGQTGPERVCIGCGSTFMQSTPMGLAKYCNKECRREHYSILGKEKRLNKPTKLI